MNVPDGSKQPAFIDPSEVDWNLVSRSTFVVHQQFKYVYSEPIRELRHHLMVVPPESFGNQRRTLHQIRVSEPADVSSHIDSFGNMVISVTAPVVERTIEFEALLGVEKSGAQAPRRLAESWLRDTRLLTLAGRTAPEAPLLRAAAELKRHRAAGIDLAELVNDWVYRAMSYVRGSSSIHTTAGEALSEGRGVCQDYAHVMIAICRLLGLPTLYVSGHLLGEGGTHAWVEVLVPASDGSDGAEAWAFDPTHGCRAGSTYLTVAVGQDYGDVAPTSGSYRARAAGSLIAHKQVRLTDLVYA